MIPTRYCQKFRNGTTAGFNFKTGSVIVMSDYTANVDQHATCDFHLIINDLLSEFDPAYVCPSTNCIKSLNRLTVNRLFVMTGKWLRTNILSRTYICTSSTAIADSIQMEIQHEIVYPYYNGVLYMYSYRINEQFNNSVLVPVILINGENCDTY